MTPEQMLSYASRLRGYPDRAADPAMPATDPNRLQPAALEALLESAKGAPIDYSGVQRAAKARGEAGGRGMLGGLALSMMGGKSMAPVGAHLFEQSLKLREPLRANAADVGYENPETGEFVENPHLERVRQEKVIQSRIDARVREEEARARLAVLQGNADAADIAKANSEQLKMLGFMIAQQNANTSALRAENAGNKDTPPKAIPVSQVKDLEGNVSSYAALSKLHDTFQNDYSGMGPLSTAQVYAESVGGGLLPKKSQERSNWWSDFKMFQELPTRHALFGATLTAGEQQAWNAAQKISPKSSPEVVKQAVKGLADAVAARNARLTRQLSTEGKDPAAYAIPGAPAQTGGASGSWLPSATDLDAELARRGGTK